MCGKNDIIVYAGIFYGFSFFRRRRGKFLSTFVGVVFVVVFFVIMKSAAVCAATTISFI